MTLISIAPGPRQIDQEEEDAPVSIPEPKSILKQSLPTRDRCWSTGDAGLDGFLGGGGLLTGGQLVEVTGCSSTGKSQLCLQLALMAVQSVPDARKYLDEDPCCVDIDGIIGINVDVAYICTESPFPAERLLEIGVKRGMDPMEFMDRILVEYLFDLESFSHILHYQMPLLIREKNIRLVIIDSIAANFRHGLDDDENDQHQKAQSAFCVQKELWSIGQCLHQLVHDHQIPIICINQVTGDEKTPALGLWWSHCIHMRLLLEKHPRFHGGHQRTMRITQCSYLPTHQPALEYQITERGFETTVDANCQ